MSRIGKLPVPVPAGVEVKIDGNTVTVKGPKGELTQTFNENMAISLGEDGSIVVERPNDARENRAMHGLTRSLINNMVIGVSEGYSKTLELVGVGYRAALKGGKLEMTLGFSHPVVVDAIEGITFECPEPTIINISGIDKQLVGQVAADIRAFRKPEPYKGKGIRYQGEHIRRKEGKAASSKRTPVVAPVNYKENGSVWISSRQRRRNCNVASAVCVARFRVRPSVHACA